MNTVRHRYFFEGEMLPIHEIAQRVGMSKGMLYHRVRKKGMTVEQAIALPPTPKKALNPDGPPKQLFEFRGELLTAAEIAKRIGRSVTTVYRRRSGNRILDGEELAGANASFQDFPVHARKITFRGETHTVAGWSRKTGLHKETIRHRLLRGWPIKYALTIPPYVGGYDTITYQGRTMPIAAWAKEVGMSPYTLRARLDKYGWNVERALFEAVSKAMQKARPTGGYQQTFAYPKGTGGGSAPGDFHGGNPA